MPGPSHSLTIVILCSLVCAAALLASGCSAAPDAPVAPDPRTVAADYAAELVCRGVEWNGDEAGRVRAGERHGDAAIGSCGQLARELRQRLLDAGFAAADVAILTGEQLRVRFRSDTVMLEIPLDWNADHAAVLVRVAPEPLVFDPWLHGRDGASFATFASSRWNGITCARWLEAMQELGYLRFRIDDGASTFAVGELLDGWRTASPPAR